MADHGNVEYATATGNDYPAHEQSYESFVHFTFVGILYVVTILFGLATGGRDGPLVPGGGDFCDRGARRHSRPGQQGDDPELCCLCDLLPDLRVHRNFAALTKFTARRGGANANCRTS